MLSSQLMLWVVRACRGKLNFGAFWVRACIVLLLAIVIRLIFFSSAIGSDEVVYSDAAIQLIHGNWPRSDYIGAIRYGINIPLAVWMSLFGYGVVGLGGLFFLCSIFQVFLALMFARHLWGESAALWSAFVLAVLPLDISLASSLNPDLYLAVTIQLSVVTFYFACQSESSRLYFLAGALAGWVFWIKEVVIVFGFVFLVFVAVERRWSKRWVWFSVGGAISIFANLVLFWLLYGDPIYPFKILNLAVTNNYIAKNIADTTIGTYFIYLFVKMHHTGFLGWFALAACVKALQQSTDYNLRFVLVWGFALLIIFSALPISISPLKFISKQSNYMVIFLFPFILLTGWFLSTQKRAASILFGILLLGSGIILAAINQQSTRTLVANGPAAVAFAEQHPDLPVFGSKTISRYSELNRVLRGALDDNNAIRSLSDMRLIVGTGGPPGDLAAFLIEDPQTLNWTSRDNDASLLAGARRCGRFVENLDPAPDFGEGRRIVRALYNGATILPSPIDLLLRNRLQPIYRVKKAVVYAITWSCLNKIGS